MEAALRIAGTPLTKTSFSASSPLPADANPITKTNERGSNDARSQFR